MIQALKNSQLSLPSPFLSYCRRFHGLALAFAAATSCRTGTALLAGLALAAWCLAAPAKAQTAHFGGVQTIIGSGMQYPGGVAVDTSGNVYIADTSNNRIVKETLSGGAYTQTVVATGLATPNAVAVDSAGNLYVTNTGANDLVKETLSNGSYTGSTVVTGLTHPSGVAVTPAGDAIYVAVMGQNSVLKETYCAGFYIESTVSTALQEPTGVDVDASGNLYIADSGNNRIVEATLSNGTYTLTPLVTGVNQPEDVAVDANGDIYIVSGPTSELLEETLSNGVYTQSVLASNFSNPLGVALDSSGNVYVADTNHKQVVEQSLPPGNFGSVSIGTTSAAETAVFVFDTAGALNGSAPVEVLTQGQGGLDYSNSGAGTCSASPNYAVNATCTVTVTFTPKFAGTRNGAVVLNSSAGNAIATGYITGSGLGAQVAFAPVQSTLFSSGLNYPAGVAVDGAGNVYIADTSNSRVLKETLSGGAYTQSTIGSGLNYPAGVAVDGAGNVYIADSRNQRVLKETLSGGAYIQSSIGSGLNIPHGVAVDGAGNVYIADTNNSRVLKETLSDGTYIQSSIGSGLSYPGDVAVDSAGNVYIANSNASNVLLETVTAPPTLAFEPTPYGSTSADSPQSASVFNNGNEAMTVSQVVFSFTNSNFKTGPSTCPEVVAVGASCTVGVDFTPNARRYPHIVFSWVVVFD